MVNLGRNEATWFQYASSLPATAQTILPIGTAGTEYHKIMVTDLIITGGANTANVKFYADNYTTAKAIDLTIATSGNIIHSFTVPYEFIVQASTGVVRNFVGSASATGCKYIITGYVE